MTTGKRPLHAEIFKGDDGKWYWRTIKNGRELSRSSQGYKHRLHGCIRSLEVEQRDLRYDADVGGLVTYDLRVSGDGLIVAVKVVDQ